LVVALLQPVDVRAERFETDGERWEAEQVELRRPGLTVRAAHARGGPGTCLADISLDGPMTIDATGGRLAADSASLCVQQRSLRVEATGLRATACRCDRPPWHVTAVGGSAVAGQGAWVSWPVLWAGPVPVAAAPLWYVPLARRRTGFLLPELGWDGADGPWGRLPLFVALGQSADLTLAAGYRRGRGADARAGLRWVASDREEGHLEATLLGAGWSVQGEGTAPLGPLRLAAAGAFTAEPDAWRATHPRFDDQRDHLRGALGASVAGPGLGAGVRAETLQDLRTGAPPFSFADGGQVLPEVWLAWAASAGPAAITVDARALQLVAWGDHETQVFDLAAAADAVLSVGPLRLRPAAGVATTVHTVDDRVRPQVARLAGQRLAGWLGGELEVGVGRAFGTTRHAVHLIADARFAEAEVMGGSPTVRIDGDAARRSRALGLTLSSRLRGPAWSSRVDVRAGYEGEAPVEGTEALAIRAHLDRRLVGLSGTSYGLGAVWARLRLGESDGVRVLGGLGRIQPDAASGWLRTVGARRSLGWQAQARAEATTVEARTVWPLGALHLGYGTYTDAEAGELLAQDGHLAYEGDCDCWRAEIRASHLRGRAAPDLWLSVTLGAAP